MASFDESEASYDNNTRSYFIAVQISWNPPVQANGNLLGYNFNLSDSSDEVLRANTSQTSVEQNVTVAPFTNYTVAVEAFTGAGSGPQESLVILSPEAGMQFINSRAVCIFVDCFPFLHLLGCLFAYTCVSHVRNDSMEP